MSDWIEAHRGIIFAILSVITIGSAFTLYSRSPDPPPLVLATVAPTRTSTTTPTPIPTLTPTPSPLRVYVTGKVHNPDVYLLPVGSTIQAAIEMAGGMTEDAADMILNLSREVEDQMQITVPAKSDNLPTPPPIRDGRPRQNVPDRSPGQIPIPSTNEKVNINTGSLNQLTQLSGIGPSIGQRIIDHREKNGSFSTIEGIMMVSGIGPKTFEKIKDDITVK
ncbi:MAG: helix-hairpin-helix domain-containing protein [Chloroflexota bacterium]